MFVLDTDILTLLFAGHPRVLSRRDHVLSSARCPACRSRTGPTESRTVQATCATKRPERLCAQTHRTRPACSTGIQFAGHPSLVFIDEAGVCRARSLLTRGTGSCVL
jgi:hypothetical protein